MTGNVLPVREVRADTGLPVLADGAQSVGAIPVDAACADFYTVSGQKWLCGPDATGALYVADPERLRVALPSAFSPQSHDEPDGSFVPKDGALRFDSGWIGGLPLAGLAAALDVHPDWRYEAASAAAARCRELLEPLVDVVTPPGHSTLVSFSPPRDPTELVAHAMGHTHQYPDGMVLMTGTLFAPTEPRKPGGAGFTHMVGDLVAIRSPKLGTLANRVNHCDKIAPWTFGVAALMRNLAARGLLG